MRADPEIGYLHTGIEKSAENLFWTQASTVIERMDYLSPLSNALCYILGVEKLLGITDDVPVRAQQARVLLCELHRIASHCVWLGTGGIDLGAISGFFYAFDLRERILDLTELSGGARMHPNYLRIGGLRDDLPDGFSRQSRRADRDVLPAHARSARALAEEPDSARPHDRRRHPQRRRCGRVGHHRPRRCARPACRTTCAARSRTAATRTTSSTS